MYPLAPTENLVVARAGEWIDDVIKKALARLKNPATPYAYFYHNGVIVTVTRKSTPRSAYNDWHKRLGVLCDSAVKELGE